MSAERQPFEIVAGLGNPGPDYSRTRHNAGFWFIDELARMLGASLQLDKRLHARVAKVVIDNRTVHLIEPYNFMNNSGQGIAGLCRFYKIDPERLLVAHDELDLPPGTLRVKFAGGHGGHNGLRDIINRLGSRDFWRLRIGIGHPGHKDAVTAHVLKRAPQSQQALIDESVELAAANATDLLHGDVNRAIQTLHSHKPAEQ